LLHIWDIAGKSDRETQFHFVLLIPVGSRKTELFVDVHSPSILGVVGDKHYVGFSERLSVYLVQTQGQGLLAAALVLALLVHHQMPDIISPLVRVIEYHDVTDHDVVPVYGK
jgi:hypothetical protein